MLWRQKNLVYYLFQKPLHVRVGVTVPQIRNWKYHNCSVSLSLSVFLLPLSVCVRAYNNDNEYHIYMFRCVYFKFVCICKEETQVNKTVQLIAKHGILCKWWRISAFSFSLSIIIWACLCKPKTHWIFANPHSPRSDYFSSNKFYFSPFACECLWIWVKGMLRIKR